MFVLLTKITNVMVMLIWFQKFEVMQITHLGRNRPSPKLNLL